MTKKYVKKGTRAEEGEKVRKWREQEFYNYERLPGYNHLLGYVLKDFKEPGDRKVRYNISIGNL